MGRPDGNIRGKPGYMLGSPFPILSILRLLKRRDEVSRTTQCPKGILSENVPGADNQQGTQFPSVGGAGGSAFWVSTKSAGPSTTERLAPFLEKRR